MGFEGVVFDIFKTTEVDSTVKRGYRPVRGTAENLSELSSSVQM